ncbi:DUF4376 domain-containing protein [Aminobacter sp. HY435]|uniref:DUF4376 domain-containing protein n=1 Tax=Aminobacter sp. HY435 TaxID=2970917 RepID=UPI0022B9CA4B|nr:DUF4376 domain-containing protein [Aminobacter sp. HY435]
MTVYFAKLDDQGTILYLEELSEFGEEIGYRPEVPFAIAQPEWEAGGTVVGGVYTPPPTSLEDLRAAKLVALAAKRWAVETGGIVVGGFPIYTDDRSKLMVTGARIKADADPAFTTKWVAADGTRTAVDATTIIAISDAMLGHVDACFDRFDVLASAIASALDKTALAAIDINAGWPPNS